MKIRFTEKDAVREGQEVDVLDAAGRRLVASGRAEEVKAKAKTSEGKPKATKTAAASKAKG